jgi:hypothetical protein
MQVDAELVVTLFDNLSLNEFTEAIMSRSYLPSTAAHGHRGESLGIREAACSRALEGND